MPTDSREYWEAVPTDARAERYCASGSRIRGRWRATQRTSLVPCGALAPRFGTMVWADFLGARDCHVTPMPLALGIASRTPITVPANSPCTILIRAGKVVRDDLTVDIPPLRPNADRSHADRGGWSIGRVRDSKAGTRFASRYATDRKRPPEMATFRLRATVNQVGAIEVIFAKYAQFSSICRGLPRAFAATPGTELLRFVNHLTVRTRRA
jgi:hypothetical protein